jgi:hypothetical protein
MSKAAELAKWGEVSTNGQVSGRRNLVINGAMQINQRGASSVTSGYFVDRFTLSACSASAVLTSSTPTEFPKAISVSATSGNPIIIQKIESKSCQGLSGKTVIASFYAKNISNATTLYASLQYAGSADNFGSSTTISEQNLGSLSGSWVKYTASWTVPSGGLNGLALNILCAGSSTFTMGVTGVQLEVGSVATPFEHRSFGEELALCQRYYWNLVNGTDNEIGIGAYQTSSELNNIIQFPVLMRTGPTLDIVTGTNYYKINRSGASDGFNSFTIARATTRNALIYNGSEISGTAGQAGETQSGNASAFLSFTAEL